MPNRRSFLRNASLAAAGVTAGMPLLSNSVIGANRRINVAVFGTNGRGNYLAEVFARATDCAVTGIGDVDLRAVAKAQETVVKGGNKKPTGNQDFRRFLDDRDIDAVVIATPDHWHAPMAIMALEAGKHVYLEKPCSHNPAEGDMLVAKQKKTGLVVQMGNQTRSSRSLNRIVGEIRDGLIGKAYAGKAWYSNIRGEMGRREKTYIPDWLDWELWQGPAPRQEYTTNLVHYDWHWTWKYGTGELLNNGTHEIDMCRWALGVDYPSKVTSSGGRYHFDDDWETPDTQVAAFEYGDQATINWEGRSCNGLNFWNRGRGSFIHGTEGSVLMDRDGYWVYNLKGEEIRSERESGLKNNSMGITGGGVLDDLHIGNFLAGINSGERLNAPIEDASVSVTTCHLGNMAQRTGEALHVDTATGKPSSEAAMKLWGREYARGWSPKV